MFHELYVWLTVHPMLEVKIKKGSRKDNFDVCSTFMSLMLGVPSIIDH